MSLRGGHLEYAQRRGVAAFGIALDEGGGSLTESQTSVYRSITELILTFPP